VLISEEIYCEGSGAIKQSPRERRRQKINKTTKDGEQRLARRGKIVVVWGDDFEPDIWPAVPSLDALK